MRELVKSMRQKGDTTFSDLLMRLRWGSLTEADVSLLESRVVGHQEGNVEEEDLRTLSPLRGDAESRLRTHSSSLPTNADGAGVKRVQFLYF